MEHAAVQIADTSDSILDRRAMLDALTGTVISDAEPSASERDRQFWTNAIQVCEATMGEAKIAKDLGITRPPIVRYRMRTVPVPTELDEQVQAFHRGYAASERANGNEDPEALGTFMVGLMRLGIRTLVEKAEAQSEPSVDVEAGPVETVVTG